MSISSLRHRGSFSAIDSFQFLLTALLTVVVLSITATVSAAPKDAADDKWEATIAAFEKMDTEHAPPENGIVFVGSSSIRLWDLKKSFPDLPTINRGFGGSEVSDSVKYADRIVTKYKPRIIVFYAGDNDLAHGKSPEQVADDVNQFVDIVRKKLPDTPILFLSIKPSRSRANFREKQEAGNLLIKKLADKDANFKFIDVGTVLLNEKGLPRKELFLDDQLHLNPKGYQLWREILNPYLK